MGWGGSDAARNQNRRDVIQNGGASGVQLSPGREAPPRALSCCEL